MEAKQAEHHPQLTRAADGDGAVDSLLELGGDASAGVGIGAVEQALKLTGKPAIEADVSLPVDRFEDRGRRAGRRLSQFLIGQLENRLEGVPVAIRAGEALDAPAEDFATLHRI